LDADACPCDHAVRGGQDVAAFERVAVDSPQINGATVSGVDAVDRFLVRLEGADARLRTAGIDRDFVVDGEGATTKRSGENRPESVHRKYAVDGEVHAMFVGNRLRVLEQIVERGA
jgi:hypothetical protein